MRAVNIIWDVDFEDDLESLPKEINIPDGMTDEDEISDYISNFAGFCHKGFSLVDRGAWSCPECDNEIQCECVIGADESGSGLTERLYSCNRCGSAWSTQEVDGVEQPPQRYFFG